MISRSFLKPHEITLFSSEFSPKLNGNLFLFIVVLSIDSKYHKNSNVLFND